MDKREIAPLADLIDSLISEADDGDEAGTSTSTS